METHTFGFRRRANVPEGQKQFPISGAIRCHPLCALGNSWAFLQYVLGFRNLGFETYYVKQVMRRIVATTPVIQRISW
jgi:hypothetical protein